MCEEMKVVITKQRKYLLNSPRLPQQERCLLPRASRDTYGDMRNIEHVQVEVMLTWIRLMFIEYSNIRACYFLAWVNRQVWSIFFLRNNLQKGEGDRIKSVLWSQWHHGAEHVNQSVSEIKQQFVMIFSCNFMNMNWHSYCSMYQWLTSRSWHWVPCHSDSSPGPSDWKRPQIRNVETKWLCMTVSRESACSPIVHVPEKLQVELVYVVVNMLPVALHQLCVGHQLLLQRNKIKLIPSLCKRSILCGFSFWFENVFH